MEKSEIIDFTQDSEYQSMYNPLMAKAKKDHQVNIRLSKDDLDALLNEILAVYHSDGKYDATEQAVFQILEKLFKSRV